ncbi:type II toxin-antitoxin system HicA family toxin [Luteimonas sp. gir]|uniref:type II toxin-antitoxin system HicA family toxin n=1 Tax=Luteimonas sp. gir TaxID=3127960 RepID=UPI003075D139
MKAKHAKTLAAIYHRPVLGTIRWADVEALLVALGAEREEREGSRVAFIWREQVFVFHRPHPRPVTDKGAVASIRRILESNGVKP